MAKRIKITERQVKLLESVAKMSNTNKIKITESQYNRLFNEQVVTEDIGITTTFIEFAEHGIQFLKDITNDPSTAGLDPFWVKRGFDRGKFLKSLIDAGVLIVGTYAAAEGTRKIFKIRKMNIIMVLKKIYNMFQKEDRYDNKTGEINDKFKEPKPQEEAVFLGTDMELEEDGGYPEGASDDPNAPFNREEHRNPKANAEHFEFVDEVNDGEAHRLLFLKDGEATYVVIYTQSSSMFEEFCSAHTNMTCIMENLNYLSENNQLEIGDCGYDCGSHMIHILNDEMKDYIMEYHARGEGLREKYANIFGLNETTTAGASSGAFEAPLGADPIKRTNFPSDELDEVTATGTSSGAYETPKIWAKDPKLSRFSKKPMYPTGTIVEDQGEKVVKYVLNLGEVYVLGKDDAEAKKEANAIVKLINKHFGEAWASAKSLHQKDREVDIYENVAKQTGKTIAEVKEIIKKKENKE